MKTFNLEVLFVKKLQERVARGYPQLLFIVPSRTLDSPMAVIPDVVLYNPNSAAVLLVEVRGGSEVNSIPMASVSGLIQMRHFRLSPQYPVEKVTVALVTSAFLPPPIRIRLEQEGIHCISIGTSEDLNGAFDELLERLGSG